MQIYTTRTDTDTLHTLVTDGFHVLQQVRLPPAPCRCMIRDGEEGAWRWASRRDARRVLAAWQRAMLSRGAGRPMPCDDGAEADALAGREAQRNADAPEGASASQGA